MKSKIEVLGRENSDSVSFINSARRKAKRELSKSGWGNGFVRILESDSIEIITPQGLLVSRLCKYGNSWASI